MSSERQWASLRAWRKELAAVEAAEREERERPIREAKESLQESATALGKLAREMVATGKDSEFMIPASVAGRRMSVAMPGQFNADEARKFAESTPEFYPSPANKAAVFDFLTRNRVNIADCATYQAAFHRLKDFGLLEPEPEPEPEAEPVEVLELEPAAPAPVETLVGVDWETGLPREFTQRQVDLMTAEDFRRAFNLKLPRLVASWR